MALNHEIVVDKVRNSFNSSSPDELALVEGAKDIGYEFMGKDDHDCYIIRDNNNQV